MHYTFAKASNVQVGNTTAEEPEETCRFGDAKGGLHGPPFSDIVFSDIKPLSVAGLY